MFTSRSCIGGGPNILSMLTPWNSNYHKKVSSETFSYRVWRTFLHHFRSHTSLPGGEHLFNRLRMRVDLVALKDVIMRVHRTGCTEFWILFFLSLPGRNVGFPAPSRCGTYTRDGTCYHSITLHLLDDAFPLVHSDSGSRHVPHIR